MSNDPDVIWQDCLTCQGEGVIRDVCDGDGGRER